MQSHVPQPVRRRSSDDSRSLVDDDLRRHVPRPDRVDRRICCLLFLSLLALYLAVSRHLHVSYDGDSMAAVARNIVDHFTIRTTGAFDDYLHLSTPYSPYGIGLSVVMAPVYALSKAIGHQELLLSFINPVVTAATGVVVYRIGRPFGGTKSAALIAASSFGMLTMALQSTTELLSEPAVGLCEALIVLGLIGSAGRMAVRHPS